MKRKYVLLALVVLLAFFLRFFRLGDIPAGIEWDEVGLAYDAYSILHTGRDQFGEFLPISFRSLDDWKPPLYVYAAIAPVALFGLDGFAARFPSAAFGLSAVVLVYFFVRELFSNLTGPRRDFLALISALFLAVSPWHLQFSRAAFETNLSVTVTLIASLFFLKGIRGNLKLFYLSAFFFGLAFFSYHSTRVVTPLILFGSLFFLRRYLPSWKNLAVFFLIYGVFVYFFIPIAASPNAQIRFRVTNDLNYEENEMKSSLSILQDKSIGSEFSGKIFHNRRISTINYPNAEKMVFNYLSHFSPEFLVERGDMPLHHAPGFGMVYFFDYIFIFIGFGVYLFFLKNRFNAVLPIWLLAAPIPAAVTWQAPHGVRAEIILPTLQIFSAIGFGFLIYVLRKESQYSFRLAGILFCAVFSFTVASYLHQYYVHTDFEVSKDWIYGREEAVEYTEEMKKGYDAVYVSLKVDQPHIFWLFYSKYPPGKYLEEGGTVSGGFAEEGNRFDKYRFRNFIYGKEAPGQKILYVGVPEEFPPGANILKKIFFVNGREALYIAD